MPQILICQNLRNNLQHPNEFIRGSTLRFLCRIKEEEILEPLIPSILSCLEHRNSYVRKNAVLAINALYKLPKGEHLLQDAPELMEKVHLLNHQADISPGLTSTKPHRYAGAVERVRSVNTPQRLPDALQPLAEPSSQIPAQPAGQCGSLG